MAEFTVTQRGARSLLYLGYSYMLNRRGRDDTVYWRCTRSQNSHCTGSVTTGPGDGRLTEADSLFVDGTFGTSPRLFYQIFTVHAVTNGRHLPLVYCLLPNKRQETYQRVFQLLEKVRVNLQLDLLPSLLVSDFELAIMNAARSIFPSASIKGCYFHFCQAILRKIQELGLQVEYKENQELRSFVRKTATPGFCATSVRSTGLDWSEGNCSRCSKGSRVRRVCRKHVVLWKLPSLCLECL